ncbi:MAG: hypothetical protein ACFCVG_07250 [Kineosporiaceae bacterium]
MPRTAVVVADVRGAPTAAATTATVDPPPEPASTGHPAVAVPSSELQVAVAPPTVTPPTLAVVPIVPPPAASWVPPDAARTPPVPAPRGPWRDHETSSSGVMTWQAPDSSPPAAPALPTEPRSPCDDPGDPALPWTGPPWAGRARHAAPRPRVGGWAVAGVLLSLLSLATSTLAVVLLTT